MAKDIFAMLQVPVKIVDIDLRSDGDRLQDTLKNMTTVRTVGLYTTYTGCTGIRDFNSWPTFSPYLYNRVWSELTCRNSLSHSRMACSRFSALIQPSVNNPDTNGAAKLLNTTRQYNYNGHELS